MLYTCKFYFLVKFAIRMWHPSFLSDLNKEALDLKDCIVISQRGKSQSLLKTLAAREDRDTRL